MKRIFILVYLISLQIPAVSAKDDDWKMGSNMLADRTARKVGDLITVTIEEQASVKKDASNDREKSLSGSMGFDLPGMQANGSAMWNALRLPEWTVNADKDFSATGSKASSDELSASITVYVTEVLPNGNLIISGDRVVNIDNELLKFTLTGMIRPDDIDRSNIILSSRVASASITYASTGEFAKSQRKGIISKIVDWIIPF